MGPPRVSVVLPVFNGEPTLPRTLDSILGQTEIDFELIAVDDGSVDATAAILADYASRDRRFRALTQPHGGITRALISGCAAARAPLIARQDCGDASRPDRLRRMVDLMHRRPECVVSASEVAYLGPGGELLYTTAHHEKDLRTALQQAGIDGIVSLPHHGSAVMRAEAYHAAGGYRAAFYFAQDLDLYIRMARLGEIFVDEEVLYEARLEVRAISSLHRREQVASAQLALALRDAGSEAERAALLARLSAIRPSKRALTRRAEANALYFIASCLRRRNDPRWRRYAADAVRRSPLHIASWVLLVRGIAAA